MASYYMLLLATLCVAFVASVPFKQAPEFLQTFDSDKDLDSDEAFEWSEEDYSDESDESNEEFVNYDKQTKSEANDLVDEIVKNINNHVLLIGRDPVELPDAINKFKWGLLSGELSYTKGWLQGLASTERWGEAKIEKAGEDTIITMPLRYPVMQFSYDYVAKFVGLGPKGGIDGRVTKTRFEVQLRIDPQSVASLEKFKFRKIGRTSLKFTGNVLTDWMANIFAAVSKPFFKPIVRDTLRASVLETIQELIEEHNKAIGSFVH